MALVESLWHDIRQSVFSLNREKSFTATVLLIFALCVSVNVVIFAIVDAVLLKPLPFFEPDRLVVCYNSYPKAGDERAGVSVPHYLERQRIAAFADAAAYRSYGVTIGESGPPEQVDSTAVTPSFFPMLGVPAALGRTFTEDEGVEGKALVTVLSDGLWRQRFGADPAVIGRTIRIDAKEYMIVGVMPPGFRFLSQRAQLWKPLTFSDNSRKPEERHSNDMHMIARLRSDVTIAQAQAQIDALNEQTMNIDPYAKFVTDAGFRAVIHDLRADYVADLRPVLLLLQAGVLFLLMIGVVNLANLLLVRATGRTKEYSVRQALGASRFQLARSLVIETLLLAIAGGLLGLCVSADALRGIGWLAADHLHLATLPTLDITVCVVALGASILLGLVLAVPVVWHTLHGDLTTALSTESRGGTTTRSVQRLRHVLIVAQIALAFVLLAGTGLLGASFIRVLAVIPGFHSDNVLTGALALPGAKYSAKDRFPFIERLTDELRALPGVISVGVTTSLPFTVFINDKAIFVEGRALAPGESLQSHYTGGVTGDYFQTLAVPLREGRFLTDDDSKADQKVCVIDEEVAHRYWPQGGALGHRLLDSPPGPEIIPYTVVGVVGAVKQNDLAETKARGAVYFPYASYHGSAFMLVVRTDQALQTIGPELRATILRLDPELPLNDLKTMTARVDDSLASRRIPLLLAGTFAAVALALAAVGIYGVLAYSVLQRRREIGVRMALGAQPTDILRQFLGLGGRLLAVALPLGLVGAWLAGRAMSGLLFGVAPTNLVVLGGTALLLAVVAMLACLLPSRRAARIAPIEALRAN